MTETNKPQAVSSVLSAFKEKLGSDDLISNDVIESLLKEIENDSAITPAKLEEAIFSPPQEPIGEKDD